VLSPSKPLAEAVSVKNEELAVEEPVIKMLNIISSRMGERAAGTWK
jgi:hypothetical protein